MELTKQILKQAVEIAPVLLWGPPGVGKTYIAHEVLGEDCPVHWCMPSDGRPEAMGHFIIGQEGTFEWHEGTVARGMREGRLIINEAHEAGEELTVCLLWALDNQETKCIVTMNGKPESLHEALQSRLPFQINVNSPTKGLRRAISTQAKRIGKEQGWDGEHLGVCLMNAISNREVDPRAALAIIRALGKYGLHDGARVVDIIHPKMGEVVEAIAKGPEVALSGEDLSGEDDDGEEA